MLLNEFNEVIELLLLCVRFEVSLSFIETIVCGRWRLLSCAVGVEYEFCV
jgi:hypothetical protein